MLAIATLVFSALFRLLPHPPNFAPLGAATVMAGRSLSAPRAALLLLASLLVSDLALARLHGYAFMSSVTPFVYGGFALQLMLGRWLRQRRSGAFAAAALGAPSFFLLSNFGVWLSGTYGLHAAGLVACYAAALPFFPATLLGDLLWVGAFSALQKAFQGARRELDASRHASILSWHASVSPPP